MKSGSGSQEHFTQSVHPAYYSNVLQTMHSVFYVGNFYLLECFDRFNKAIVALFT